MIYVGKSLDGFAHSFQNLLRLHHGSVIPFLDAFSFRCFAFSNGSKPSEWFAPVLTWSEYLPTLEENLQQGAFFSAVPCEAYREEEQDSQWILAGELEAPIGIDVFQSRFYNSAKGFLLCRKLKTGIYEFCNPTGCHSYTADRGEWERILSSSSGFILTLNRLPMPVPGAYRAVWRKGIAWRKQVVRLPDCSQGYAYESSFHNTSSNRISLRYGLMNFQVQLHKALMFSKSALSLNQATCETLFRSLLRVPMVGKSLALDELRRIEAEFCKVNPLVKTNFRQFLSWIAG